MNPLARADKGEQPHPPGGGALHLGAGLSLMR
jgi:hypothetical protein